MKTIYKYTFPVEDNLQIAMPDGAVILTVQVQDNKACMWVLVDPDKPKTIRKFKLYSTGHLISPIDAVLIDYIGTIQLLGGSLVFHLFEDISARLGS